MSPFETNEPAIAHPIHAMSKPVHSATMLVVDPDENYSATLRRAFERRGYHVMQAFDFAQAISMAERQRPDFATIDLRLPGGSGLDLLARLHALHPAARIIVLTSYASIATAVAAIKLGALDYLPKPVDVEGLEAAFSGNQASTELVAFDRLMSVDRLEWEHIQRALVTNQGNVSATARALGMHRRTLQRKLAKRPVRS